MNLFEFLKKFIPKEQLSFLAECFELNPNGTKANILSRLQRANLFGINFVLLENFKKEELSFICKKMKLKQSGTKTELEDRIIDQIEIPPEFYSDHDFYNVESGSLYCFNLDKEYILRKYFRKEQLKELCYRFGDSATGTVEDLVFRLNQNNAVEVSFVVSLLRNEYVLELAEDLEIEVDDSPINMVAKEVSSEIQSRETSRLEFIPSKRKAYDVAISFAGENRDVAELIKSSLEDRYISVFYDQNEQSKLWGKNLYEHLSYIYSESAEFCIILISEHYVIKKWTTLEKQSAQARAFREKREYILPVKLDDTTIPDIPETIGYLDYPENSPDEIAEAIVEKLNQLRQSNSG